MWESWPSWILQMGWAELGMRNALSAAWGPHHAAGSGAAGYERLAKHSEQTAG
jgi:hypothetical protein